MESLKSLEFQAGKIAGLLDRSGIRFAVIGGIAVSFRSIERTTKDIDLAVAVASDAEAEAIINSLIPNGYRVETHLEQDATNRLSTVRLTSNDHEEMCVDLLFASSGIEAEIVDRAEKIEIFQNVGVLVATRPSLIALKVLSADNKRRLKDVFDLQNLLEKTPPEEIDEARGLLDIITKRGFNRDKDLQKDLDGYIEQFAVSGERSAKSKK